MSLIYEEQSFGFYSVDLYSLTFKMDLFYRDYENWTQPLGLDEMPTNLVKLSLPSLGSLIADIIHSSLIYLWFFSILS